MKEVDKMIISILIALFSFGGLQLFADGGAGHALMQTQPRDTVNNPQLVRAAGDGSLLLTAENGKGVGPDIKYMPEWRAFGWFTAADHVEWDVKVTKGGEYDAYLFWSVSDEESGKPFILEVNDEQIRGIVGRTGSWETFRTKKIGRIRLTKGRQKVLFGPASDFEEGGALLDLRAVKFVRAN